MAEFCWILLIWVDFPGLRLAFSDNLVDWGFAFVFWLLGIEIASFCFWHFEWFEGILLA